MTSIPPRDFTGISPISLAYAFSWMPKALGMEGPVISASMTAEWYPFFCMEEASREVTRDFPTPPLPLTTAITFLMLDIS